MFINIYRKNRNAMRARKKEGCCLQHDCEVLNLKHKRAQVQQKCDDNALANLTCS